MTLSDHKAVIATVSFHSISLRAPKWRFNTTLLRDESFKAQFLYHLKEFIDINKGSVEDARILWDATKGFIRSNATLYSSTLRKARLSRLNDLEHKLLALNRILQQNFDNDVALQYDLVKKDINDVLKRNAEFSIHRTHQKYF